MRKIYLLFFLCLAAYLLINTGVVSDDITHMSGMQYKSVPELLLPQGAWLSTPLENYTHRIWYFFFRFDNSFLADILKIIYACLSFYLIARFFSLYLNWQHAFLTSFLFIFFPSHDSTAYWFLGQYLMLSMAFYLYAYYLAHNGRITLSVLFAVFGSFISYGSPVIAVTLFIMFLMQRQFRKGAAILAPNILYIIYYVLITKTAGKGVDRIPHLDVYGVLKHLALQAGGFVDAVFGPSMWLKIYYALSQISALSVVVGLVTVFALLKMNGGRQKTDKRLLAGLVIMTLLSFLMFAVTGRYPQIAFNLGNRTTIFGSLLVSYLIVLAPRMARNALIIVLVFAILGISDHWKRWSVHQKEVMAAILGNKVLSDGYEGLLYVSGNQYSKFGGISHIEFLSEESVVGPFFKFASGGRIMAIPLNKRFRYEDGCLVDTKYGERYEVEGSITVYDSQNDKLMIVRSEDIDSYIRSLPDDHRHWIQLSKNGVLKKIILKAMPGLRYAF